MASNSNDRLCCEQKRSTSHTNKHESGLFVKFGVISWIVQGLSDCCHFYCLRKYSVEGVANRLESSLSDRVRSNWSTAWRPTHVNPLTKTRSRARLRDSRYMPPRF